MKVVHISSECQGKGSWGGRTEIRLSAQVATCFHLLWWHQLLPQSPHLSPTPCCCSLGTVILLPVAQLHLLLACYKGRLAWVLSLWSFRGAPQQRRWGCHIGGATLLQRWSHNGHPEGEGKETVSLGNVGGRRRGVWERNPTQETGGCKTLALITQHLDAVADHYYRWYHLSSKQAFLHCPLIRHTLGHEGMQTFLSRPKRIIPALQGGHLPLGGMSQGRDPLH